MYKARLDAIKRRVMNSEFFDDSESRTNQRIRVSYLAKFWNDCEKLFLAFQYIFLAGFHGCQVFNGVFNASL